MNTRSSVREQKLPSRTKNTVWSWLHNH